MRMTPKANALGLRASLAYRQAQIAVFAGLLLGLTFSFLQIATDLRREVKNIDATYARSLAAFEDAAFQAAFGLDKELAERVVDGLMLQPAVIEASIIDSYGDVMSLKRQPQSPSRFPWLVEATFGQSRAFHSILTDGNSTFVAGKINVMVDTNVLAHAFLQRSALVLGFGVLRNLVLAILLTYLFFRLVTRPLRDMARAIGAGGETLSVPRRNRGDELGALALAYNLETQRRTLTERQLSAEEQKHSALFETSDISQWLVDFSAVDLLLQQLRRDAVTNLGEHLDQHPKLISELIVKLRVSSVNNATLRMFTTHRGSDYVQTLGGILAEEMRNVLRDLLVAIWQGQGAFAKETLLRSQDNRQFPAIITIPLPPAGSPLQTRTMSIVDISMLQNHAGDYSLQNEILNALEDGICTVRLADTSILTVNPAFERMFLHSASKLQGQPLLLLSVKTADARDGQVQNLASVIKAEKDWGGLVQCQRRDGVEFTCHVQVSSHFHVDHGALAILSFRPAQIDGPSA